MTAIKYKFKRGDVVKAIAGDEKGKSGKVLQFIPQKNRALVEGLNMMKKHMRATEESPEGGIVEREAPIHVSNLTLVSSDSKAAKKDKG